MGRIMSDSVSQVCHKKLAFVCLRVVSKYRTKDGPRQILVVIGTYSTPNRRKPHSVLLDADWGRPVRGPYHREDVNGSNICNVSLSSHSSVSASYGEGRSWGGQNYPAYLTTEEGRYQYVHIQYTGMTGEVIRRDYFPSCQDVYYCETPQKDRIWHANGIGRIIIRSCGSMDLCLRDPQTEDIIEIVSCMRTEIERPILQSLSWAEYFLPFSMQITAPQTSSRVSLRQSGQIHAEDGLCHVEVIGGKKYPKKWIWGMGFQPYHPDDSSEKNTDTGVYWQIIGFGNPKKWPKSQFWFARFQTKSVHWDFCSILGDKFEVSSNPNFGTLQLVAKSRGSSIMDKIRWWKTHSRRVHLYLSAPPESFQGGLFKPTKKGFANVLGCSHTYSASGFVTLESYGTNPSRPIMEEMHAISSSLLEFGGTCADRSVTN